MDTTTIICLIILALAAAGIIGYWYLNKPTEEQKKMAKEFVDSLYDSIFETVKTSIAKKVIEPDGKSIFYLDIEFFKNDLINGIYNDVWDFVKLAIENMAPKEIKFLTKLVTRENIETLVNTIISCEEIQKLIAGQYECQLKIAYANMEKEEKDAISKAVLAEEGIVDGDEKAPELDPIPEVEESNYPDKVEIDPNDPTVEEI